MPSDPYPRLNAARYISMAVLIALIVVLSIMFYRVIAPFLLPLFLAWIVAILIRPVYLGFARKSSGRRRLAAGITAGLLVIGILIPIVVGTVFGANELFHLARRTVRNEEWRQEVAALQDQPWVLDLAARLELFLTPDLSGVAAGAAVENGAVEIGDERLEVDPLIDTPEAIDPSANAEVETADDATRLSRIRNDAERLHERIRTSLRATLALLGQRTLSVAGAVPAVALGFLGQVAGVLVALATFVIALYYFLCDGPSMLAAAKALIPVSEAYQRQLYDRFDTVVRAVVVSTFLAALVQGFLTTVALGFAGFHSYFLIFLLSSMCAMIPMAGTWLVWGPCAVWLGLQGQWGTVLLLTMFGFGVIGTVDNLIRTWILNTDAKLHPLLAFVSVLGGLQVLGLWGVFIGPVVAACLHALVQIFNTELMLVSQSRQQAVSPLAGTDEFPTADADPTIGPAPAALPDTTNAVEDRAGVENRAGEVTAVTDPPATLGRGKQPPPEVKPADNRSRKRSRHRRGK